MTRITGRKGEEKDRLIWAFHGKPYFYLAPKNLESKNINISLWA
jgi:hypothetical protein